MIRALTLVILEGNLRLRLRLPVSWLSSRRDLLLLFQPTLFAFLLTATAPAQRLPTDQLAHQYFGQDSPWYQTNIPFFETNDPELQQIYYYRWQLFRAHLRDLGPQRYTVTEFLEDVPWARHPYTDLNDSSSFHLLEARWLRDPRYATSLLDHLYTGAGNDRHFSESIAAAAYAVTEVTGDPGPALRHLDTMQYLYNAWDDHFDRTRKLYWIEPLLDATEYTISSIDASGAGFTDHPSTDQNHNGFTGGYSYRPSINAYQYGNALAIAALARIAGQPEVATDYEARAARLQRAVVEQLWNPQLQHFTDVYQRSTKYVTAGDFIRGRELVGFVPWQFHLPLPAQSPAWQHALNAAELAGPQGLRTVEPTYPKYLVQYRYDAPTGLPECQWNGPSWPFQTSQTLTALANLLDDYPAAAPTPANYYTLLKQYAHQHFVEGKPDLQEDYFPDVGSPIVGLPRSHHYNHSTFNDLILSGLAGIRPDSSNTLHITAILAPDLHYFAVENLQYHGHTLALYYDRKGTRYHLGPGLTLFVDGQQKAHAPTHLAVTLTPVPPANLPPFPLNVAANPGLPELTQATASTTLAGTSPAEAIDGRLWLFPEIPNGWSPLPTDSTPTLTLDLRQPTTLATIDLYFTTPPPTFRLQSLAPTGWQDIPNQHRTATHITFPPLTTPQLRLLLSTPNFRLVELKAYSP